MGAGGEKEEGEGEGRRGGRTERKKVREKKKQTNKKRQEKSLNLEEIGYPVSENLDFLGSTYFIYGGK